MSGPIELADLDRLINRYVAVSGLARAGIVPEGLRVEERRRAWAHLGYSPDQIDFMERVIANEPEKPTAPSPRREGRQEDDVTDETSAELVHYLAITHHPDLLAAVQREALDRYGLRLEAWEVDAALLWVEECPPIEAAHHAAAAVLYRTFRPEGTQQRD